MDLILGFAGTLDPITIGHEYVINEASELAKKVYVFISENPVKKPAVSAVQRKAIVDEVIAERGWTNVESMIIRRDYTARAAKRCGVTRMIRGQRNTMDFDAENLLQQTNVDIIANLKTIFVMPPRDLGSVSSSYVKSLISGSPVGWHWKAQRFVSGPAYRSIRLSWLQSEWDSLWDYDKIDESGNRHRYQHYFELLTGDTMYGSPNRHYHDLDHLVHVLSEINAWYSNAVEPLDGASLYNSDDVRKLKMALWFHDAIQGNADHSKTSDEEMSAQAWLKAHLVNFDEAEEVANLIRCTDHLQSNEITHKLKDLLIGADLSILGQEFVNSSGERTDYLKYAANVRLEYGAFSDVEYAAGRARVLRHLVDKASDGVLFNDSYFSELYNDAAILNMSKELQSLSRT